MNTQPLTSAPFDCYQFARSTILSSWWNRVCDRFMAQLLQRQDPVVTEQYTTNSSFWQIYDPNTEQTVHVRSQQEALLWIEQKRHRQAPKASFNQPRH